MSTSSPEPARPGAAPIALAFFLAPLVAAAQGPADGFGFERPKVQAVPPTGSPRETYRSPNGPVSIAASVIGIDCTL